MCCIHDSQNEFEEFFSQENDLLFSNDVFFVTKALGHQNDPTDCRFFVYYSQFIFKALLLHNRNKFPSVRLAHFANLKSPMKIRN